MEVWSERLGSIGLSRSVLTAQHSAALRTTIGKIACTRGALRGNPHAKLSDTLQLAQDLALPLN